MIVNMLIELIYICIYAYEKLFQKQKDDINICYRYVKNDSLFNVNLKLDFVKFCQVLQIAFSYSKGCFLITPLSLLLA